ncbi:FAD-dependent oxidoreductase [Alcaligenes endophyticus]|uniref:FAD-dependent oxidoreductase n=1 Tax=Alcaligenes endophyticus TaxID=1929088 RepID=A0ABT8EM81_9BURK|nr:FAD-dependent oxidoreductase [Alcaligenes endophyticus]MCX5591027.1 FAD-dependent oxidoreductase [Alcaligenes endophyticus]MDN4122396.1 FAD-dependent oxidoreductase [Alcaligenes endophyticus]
MGKKIETPVLIIGAGPVGLTLAIDLAWRGVAVTVIEQRARDVLPPVKCNHTSARSMEIFRRLGLASKLRSSGLPEDYPHSISYRTSATGVELTKIPIPSRKDRYTETEGPDCGWPTPEPPHRINQIFLEPILFEHADTLSNIQILSSTEFVGVTQTETDATVTVRNLLSGETYDISCQYMIGCDGGKSSVRKAIGATLQGDAVIQRVQSTYIRARSLLENMPEGPAWATFSLNPKRCGNMYAIDGVERWLIHNYLKDDEPDFDSVDRDAAIRDILGVAPDFEYEVLSNEDWYGRRLVADKFRSQRIFLCGDSAHIWVPYAGYGMNAGIADAANLSWLLAAHLNGWAPASILNAYTLERQPITEQVSHFVMDHCMAMARQRMSVPDNITEDSPAGEAARQKLGEDAYALNVQQYACSGLNFGYFYDQSPLIAYDAEKQPSYSMATYTPSTVPGCRTPHLWLRDGRSLYDALGPEYTLLRLDPQIDVSPIMTAAQEQGVPLQVLDVDSDEASVLYPQKLVLSRPDQHIAWRGDAIPPDVSGLIDRIRGVYSN